MDTASDMTAALVRGWNHVVRAPTHSRLESFSIAAWNEAYTSNAKMVFTTYPCVLPPAVDDLDASVEDLVHAQNRGWLLEDFIPPVTQDLSELALAFDVPGPARSGRKNIG